MLHVDLIETCLNWIKRHPNRYKGDFYDMFWYSDIECSDHFNAVREFLSAIWERESGEKNDPYVVLFLKEDELLLQLLELVALLDAISRLGGQLAPKRLHYAFHLRHLRGLSIKIIYFNYNHKITKITLFSDFKNWCINFRLFIQTYLVDHQFIRNS